MARPRWVKSQAECNIAFLFEALLKEVERDVHDANEYSPLLRDGYQFRLTVPANEPPVCFEVRRFIPSSNDQPRVVKFECLQGVIKITGARHSNHPSTICGMPYWEPESNRCSLVVSEHSYELWQISQLALSSLIFAP